MRDLGRRITPTSQAWHSSSSDSLPLDWPCSCSISTHVQHYHRNLSNRNCETSGICAFDMGRVCEHLPHSRLRSALQALRGEGSERNLLISSYQRTAEEDHTSAPEKVIGWWQRGHTHLTRCIDTSDSEGLLGMLGHFSIHSYQFLASAVLGWEGRGLVLLHALHY